MKILFDQNMPWGLRKPLSEHEVVAAGEVGWAEERNGQLLTLAEQAGFELFITGDRNIRYQQNLSKRRIAIIELTSMQWPSVRLSMGAIVDAVNSASQGSYQVVECRPIADQLSKPTKKIP